MRYKEMVSEAKCTVMALIMLIIFWLLAGIVGSGVEIRIYSIPIWAIIGTLGVWIAGIVIAAVLSRTIKDADL